MQSIGVLVYFTIVYYDLHFMHDGRIMYRDAEHSMCKMALAVYCTGGLNVCKELKID